MWEKQWEADLVAFEDIEVDFRDCRCCNRSQKVSLIENTEQVKYTDTCNIKQWGVTPIDSILLPVTGVKNFDRQFRYLTFDFS